MAGVKISNLPAAGTLTGTELVAVVQGGITSQTTAAALTGVGSGTVTSVAATVPAFLSITGSPVTTSGTLAISYSGTPLPIANGGTNSAVAPTAGAVPYGTGSAYGFTAAGSSGQFLKSNGTGAPTWATVTGTGTVTSVAATVPAFLSVTGSPITAAGTLAIAYSGTALPIANGGTNSTTATPTSGGVSYGTGTAYAFSAAGTTGQYLKSNGSSAPSWATPSSPALENSLAMTPGTVGANSSYTSSLMVTGAALGNFVQMSYDKALGDVFVTGEVISATSLNYALYSEDISNTTGDYNPPIQSWTLTGATVTSNATTAPTGAATADKLVEDTSTGNHWDKSLVKPSYFASGSIVTASVYAKAAERTAFRLTGYDGAGSTVVNVTFDLSTITTTVVSGSAQLITMTNAGNGWYRCSITYSVGTVGVIALATGIFLVDLSLGTPGSYTGNGVSGAYFWGMQYEIQPYPTTYIATLFYAASGTFYPVSVKFRNPTSSGIAVTSGTVYAKVVAPGTSTN